MMRFAFCKHNSGSFQRTDWRGKWLQVGSCISSLEQNSSVKHEIGVHPSERTEEVCNVWDAKNEQKEALEITPRSLH